MNTAYVNGRFLPLEVATVPVLDRGFLYGDGCFETLRVEQGRPGFWREHLRRLWSTLEWLRIPPPRTPEQLAMLVGSLIRRNRSGQSLLRLQVTRGKGPRGDSIGKARSPSLALTQHPLPEPSRGRALALASLRLDPASGLGARKLCGRALWILGRAEAEDGGADEPLFLTCQGEVACAGSGNVFWQERDRLHTPPLSLGILPGITRQAVIALCRQEGVPCEETRAAPQRIQQGRGAFLTRSSEGLVPVASLEGRSLPPCPLLQRLKPGYDRIALQTPFP